MVAFRRYSVALVGVALATLGSILAMALWLAPLKNQELGDLARIGWYSNNLWSFRKPIAEFAQPLYKVVKQYDKYSDVYILGDSFSLRPHQSWPNYLASAGISSQVVGIGDEPDRSVEELVASPLFQERPPKVVVYASVERAFQWRMERIYADCAQPAVPRPEIKIEPGLQRNLAGREVLQPMKGDLSEDQITYARDFIVKNLDRRLFAKRWQVYDRSLKAARFSSVVADRVLLISDDAEKAYWTEADLAHMRCVLRSFQNKVQANAKTLFVVMVIPDKLSVYHADLVDPASQPVSIIPRLEDPALLSTRLDRALRAAVERGEIDVYLPNDTHWGPVGHRLAAETLLALLREQGVLPAQRRDSALPGVARSRCFPSPARLSSCSSSHRGPAQHPALSTSRGV
jgi:hypothetical protein